MVATVQNIYSSNRLTIQTRNLDNQTTAIRCLDWDRDRFDIEFGLRNGTTYNSFIIQGEKTALIDTSHKKFETIYLEEIQNQIDLNSLDYLIISHTEPDHSGLVKDILKLAPQVRVVGSKVAVQFLENLVNQSFDSLQVKNGDTLDLGENHILEFVSAPNLHWPDTIFTYDQKSRILFTCDAFGMHYCDDLLYDEETELLEEDFKYYYDCLMGPNARSVLSAIKRMAKFEIDLIATGHGPLLQNHLSDWVNKYEQWSKDQAKTETLVAVVYAEGYGYSEHLAQAIAKGISKTNVAIEWIDITSVEPHEVRELVMAASGIVLGMPSQSDSSAITVISTILAAAHSKQSIGVFESGGGEDEPIYPLRNKFQEIGLKEAFTPILVKEIPTPAIDKLCEEAGTDLGQWLTRDKTIKQIKEINHDLDRALGRISGGLYIITTQKGDVSGAMLASWVIQGSTKPLGVAIAVAKDRAIESLMQVGDSFILNVLEEDNYQGLMKHFLKRFPPGADRFAGVKTYQGTNGSPILADALAYMECQVTSRLENSDHWIIYSVVHKGRVSKSEALTAIHHRKVGNHY